MMNNYSPLSQADVDSLIVRCNGNRQLAVNMIKLFQKEANRYLYELLKASSPKDWCQVARAAHTIRGSAAMVSANSMAAVAEELESFANFYGANVEAQQKMMELVNMLRSWQELDPESVAIQFEFDDR